jgi:hypothetical protein
MTETFPIIPAQTNVSWIIAILLLLTLGTFAALNYSFTGARRSHFDISPEGLRLHGDFYGRFIPMGEVEVDSARVVDLRQDTELKPSFRLMGTAISGYRAGWFRLKNGRRALLYVTDVSHVVYIPTTRGYVVLLSVTNPDTFLASLRRASGAEMAPPEAS